MRYEATRPANIPVKEFLELDFYLVKRATARQPIVTPQRSFQAAAPFAPDALEGFSHKSMKNQKKGHPKVALVQGGAGSPPSS